MKPRWNDEYWLLLMQIYIKKPAGVKPIYSRDMVNLALELHLPPKYLYRKMFSLRSLETPRLERLWNTYAKSPRKLAKGVNLLRRMHGFNNADLFYEGVEVNESFETDFKPLPECPQLTPMMLVIILDLYFRLTPNTMVASTPEIIDMAKKVTGTDFTVTEEARRAGDPAILIASSEKVRKVLGWKPEHSSTEEIIASAWKWHKGHPYGYAK